MKFINAYDLKDASPICYITTAYESALMVRFVISLHLPLEEFLDCMVMVEMPGL